jgi:hypothetical protein
MSGSGWTEKKIERTNEMAVLYGSGLREEGNAGDEPFLSVHVDTRELSDLRIKAVAQILELWSSL